MWACVGVWVCGRGEGEKRPRPFSETEGLVLQGREGASGHALCWRVQHVCRFWVFSRRWQVGCFSLPRVVCLCMTQSFMQKKSTRKNCQESEKQLRRTLGQTFMVQKHACVNLKNTLVVRRVGRAHFASLQITVGPKPINRCEQHKHRSCAMTKKNNGESTGVSTIRLEDWKLCLHQFQHFPQTRI